MSDDRRDTEADIAHPERFTVGVVGDVGERLFLLRCEQGPSTLTLKVEKRQVALLASYLARIVRELGRPGHLPEDLAFDPPADPDPDWVVGTIGVSYDADLDRLILVVEEAVDDDDDAVLLRILLSREQAAAFAIRATSLVEAGRPSCPLCGFPIDPTGHVCPRTNGNRPPAA